MADTRLGKIGITVKEPWAADISFEVLDMTLNAVENGGDGCSYVALRDNIGVTPGTDPNTWVKSTQAGQSIYDLAVKYHHFVGTEEEFEAQYQAVLQAARDAAAGASAVEAQVEAAETARVAAETGRADAESARQSAEASRASAETARGTAEAARQSAESGRASAETARVTAEQGRVSAESDRVSAEAARAAAETDRVSDFSALRTDMQTAIGQADAATAAAVATNNQIQTAETGRVSAEQGRVSAETARASAESARATAETGRATAESARVTAEGQRATAEGQRVTAENARVSAESGRASAESGRVSAEAARVSAETARESQASSDHTTAVADHAIVQGYDTRLTNVEGEVSQLGQEVDGINSVLDLTQYTQYSGITISSGNIWASSTSNNKIIFIPTGNAKNVKIKTTTIAAVFAFLKSDTVGSPGDDVDFANGETSRRTLDINSEQTIAIPSGTNYIYLATSGSDGVDRRSTYTFTLLAKGLSEKVEKLEEGMVLLQPYSKEYPKKIAYTNNAVYNESSSSATLTIDTVAYFNIGTNSIVIVYANGTSESHQPKTFTFNTSGRNLVIDNSGSMVQRTNMAAILDSDVVLLSYDTNIHRFVGGLLYPDYVRSLVDSVDGYVDRFINKFIISPSATYTASTVTLESCMVQKDSGLQTIYCNQGHTAETYDLSTNNSCHLVIDANNAIVKRTSFGAIQDTDIVLLSAASGIILGGALYADYVAKYESKIEERRFQSVYCPTASYTKNSAIISSVSCYRFSDNSVQTYTWRSGQEPTDNEVKFGANSGYFFLVVDKDGYLAVRGTSSDKLAHADDMLILLQYHNSAGTFVGGELYTDFVLKYLSDTKRLTYDTYESDVPENIGVYNALKKAQQMLNVPWKPVAATMPYGNSTSQYFNKDTASDYEGLPYSSVKEYNQFVFEDVSLETFMTAVKNPRSVLYTERVASSASVSELGRTYHGVNCACYYGVVCNSLIGYAWGIPISLYTKELNGWEELEQVEDQSAYGVKLADCLLSASHVALVTDIKRNKRGVISSITVVENASGTTSSNTITPSEFNTLLGTIGYTIYRYKNLYKNTQYIPQTAFVAVEDETPGSYDYNTDLCPNYGDKSNYAEGDDVVINILSDYSTLGYTGIEVYKDDVLIDTISITGDDITLSGLTYGSYKARLVGTDISSDYCYWMVVNMSMSVDLATNKITFSSANATPYYYDLSALNGSRGMGGLTGKTYHMFTSAEITAGEAEIDYPTIDLTGDYKYMKVHFKTAYGTVRIMAEIQPA